MPIPFILFVVNAILTAVTIKKMLTIDSLKKTLRSEENAKLRERCKRATTARITSILNKGAYNSVNIGLYDRSEKHFDDLEIKAEGGIDSTQIYVGRIIEICDLIN